MKLKIPPVVVMLICGIIMWLVANIIALPLSHDFAGRLVATAVFVLLSTFVLTWSLYSFKKHNTTVDPTKPDKTNELVQEGVYTISRNPMYLGMLLLLVAWAVFLCNVVNIIAIVLFIGYITTFQIKPEEHVLREKFGEVYLRYCKKVRQWI